MTDSTQNTPQTDGADDADAQKKNPWPKRAAIGGGIGALILIIAYIGIGSSFFVRSIVLPIVEKSMMAKVSVGKVAFSPLSGIELQDLDFSPADQETMVSAQRATIQYSLSDIIGGTIKLNQLHLENPKVTIIEREDGSSNLTDWLDSLPPSPDAPLPIMDLNDLDVSNGTIVYRKMDSSQTGNQVEIALSKAHVSRIGQNLSGNINLESLIRMVKLKGDSNDQEELLSTQITLKGDLDLNDVMFPKKSSLSGSMAVLSASPAYADVMGVGGAITLTVQPDSLEEVSVRFSKNGKSAGSIELSGPINFNSLEGDLQLALSGLNRQFLNLAGAIVGLDFGDTVIDGTLSCVLTKGASQVALSTVTKAKDFSVSMDDLALPGMDTELKLVALYDAEQESVIIREWNLNASNNGKTWLQGSIDKPVTLSWGLNRQNFQDSNFQLKIEHMDLLPWNSVLGGMVQQGELNGDLDMAFLQQGKLIKASVQGDLSKANFTLNDQNLNDQRINLKTELTIQDFTRVIVEQTSLEWRNSSDEVLAYILNSGNYHLDKPGLQFQVNATGNLPLLCSLFPLDGMVVEKGEGKLTARIQQLEDGWSGNVQTALSGYTGRFGGVPFQQYSLELGVDGNLLGKTVRLVNTQIAFKDGFDLGGSIGVNGELDLSVMKGTLNIQSSGLNRHALQPILGEDSSDGPFREVSLNLEGALDLNLSAESSFQGTANISDLQYKDAATETTQKLMTEFGWNLGWTAEQLDIRNGTLRLSPTAKAGNTLKVSGHLPLKPGLSSKGALNVSSASLDLTPYMDLLMTQTEANKASPAPETQEKVEPATPVPTASEAEPLEVPLGELDAQVDIGKLFARELTVQDLKGRMLWQTNTLHLEPLSMQVNNGPVKASLHMDFTQPDWGYQMNFDAQNVPVQAITDTLDPANKGKVSGLFFAKGDWSGAGLTEPALQRNLGGSMTMQYKDANIELVSPTIRLLLSPITALLRLPELMKAPISGLEANVNVQNQTLSVKDTKVLSNAFQVHTAGEIPLANVLTNSVLNLPVEFHLERSIAKKSNLIPSSAPEGTPFVKLPDFVKLQGTVGKPVTKTDKLVLSGLLVKSAAGLPLNVGEGAVNALKGVGNFLVGDSGNKNGEEGASGESIEEGEKEPSSGVLQQVNPFKLFDQLRGNREKQPEQQPEKPSKEDP